MIQNQICFSNNISFGKKDWFNHWSSCHVYVMARNLLGVSEIADND